MAKTVLVVDDSVFMRHMVSFTLSDAGYDVIEAGDGKEAVDKLNNGTKPNLVIADLNMPYMDGISLIKAVREMTAHKCTPILMLTTESSEKNRKEGLNSGATGWIVKPFSSEQILTMVEKLLTGKRNVMRPGVKE